MVLEGLAEAKKCLVAFFLFASGLLLPFLISVPAYAQQTPFPDCSTSVYLGQNIPTQLFRVNTATNPFTYPAIGAAYSGNYNAIAYNPADNFIYAVNRQAGQNIQLLRIGSGGGVVVLGDLIGSINATPGAPIAGEIGADGFFYLKHGDSQVFRINLATRVASSPIVMSQARGTLDLAWYNGLLYGHDGTSLYTINPANGQVQVKGASNHGFGGMVSASNGIFGIDNNGGFYQINPQTGATTLISASPTTTNNDAAHCLDAPLQFGADLSITKTDNATFYIPGASRTYSIVVRNNGPFGVQDALVSDPLPSGITSASWTCGGATGGGSCGQASGTGAIVNRPVNLPVGATVTFTTTLQIPAGRTGLLSNVATVTPPDTALDSNMANNTATDVDAVVAISKQLFAENGSIANFAEPGEQLTYRITLSNPGSVAVTGYSVIDTLDPNTSFVSASVGGVASGGNVTWTGLAIPAGGSLALNLVASVNDPLPAGLSRIANIARAPGGPVPPCPSAQCVQTPIATSVTYSKSTNATNARIGDVINYTLTARVLHSATTGIVTLTDTLGAGLDFTAVTSAGAFTCNGASPLVCTLPAGTAVGTYSLTYTATVNATATGSVTNAVVGTGGGGGNPACAGVCGTNTPLVAPEVVFAKSASTAGPVKAGDVITYTLTTTIANSKTTSDVVLLTDTLGTGIDFTAVTSAGLYTVDASGAPVVRFTLPAGTGPGTYAVSYTATVNDRASGSVSNAVVGSGPDQPTCTTGCGTETSVEDPVVTYFKSVSAPAATVKEGDTLTYTLTATVANSATTGVFTLTDTAGAGLDFGAVTSAGAFTCNAADPLICTLPAGTAVGTYSLTYTAVVNASATGTVTNAVVGTGGGEGNPACSGTCDTSTTVTSPAVTYAKSANVTEARVGDTIEYSLTATVTNSPTTDIVTLTDTPGAGLDFTAVINAGAFACNAEIPLVCTLPAGTAVGTYSLTYAAVVNATASNGSVTNAVVGTGGGGGNPTCSGVCDTNTPLIAPEVIFAKTASTAGPVKAGDVITYTLTTTIANSKTTSDVVLLTDTLGTGIDFTAVTSAGAYGVDASGAPVVRFTLPAGTGPGTYAVSYTATVNDQASGSVSNVVVGSGPDNPVCTTACGTDTSVKDPVVTYHKSVSAPGATVKVGDTLSYTLTATVADAATTDIVTLTDTPGAGLDFTAVTIAGAFTCNAASPLVCTLPAGTAVGSYSLTYTATVNATASGTVTNAVVGSGGGGGNPACSGACDTSTIVTPSTITYGKTTSATNAKVGDILTFTLTATVADAATDAIFTLTDTPGAGLDFTAVTSAGAFTCNAASPLVCTLPARTAVGTYSLTYTATVNATASGSVTNAVVGTGGGGGNPACAGACDTDTPLVAPEVIFAKTASTAGPVKAGDVITYTLTTTIANSKTTSDVVLLTDTLGTGIDFTAVTSAGAYGVDASGAPVVRFTLPAGTGPGTYAVSYTATVNERASGTVSNAVVGSGTDNPVCTTACGTETNVIAPAVTYAKSANVAQAKVGDTIEYSLIATVTNSPTTDVVTLTDTPGMGLDFTAVTSAGAFTCNAASPLICTLPAGTPTGTYSLTYSAVVNASASNGSVTNAVVGTGGGGGNPTCSGACGTNTPLVAPEVVFAKSASTAGPVKAGDVITYTLTTTIANSKTTSDVVLLTDTLGTGIDFTAVTSAGLYTVDASGAPVVRFTLPAGTGPGTYAVSYTATVNDRASETVSNVVVGSGTDNPTCTTGCGTETNVIVPTVTYAKNVDATQAKVGDTLTYTLTATVADAPTIEIVALTDTLGSGLDFGAVTSAGAFTCNGAGPLVCTLPAGTAVGTYSLTYTATVNATATGSVTNAVVGTGGGGGNPACAGVCGTNTPLVAPEVVFAKSASTAGPVKAGDVITYTLTTTIANSKTTSDVVLLTDTLGTGIDFTAVTSAGLYTVDASGAPVVRFTLPAGTGPGTYAVSYTATVNDRASGSVSNAVVGSGPDQPTCTTGCGTETSVEDPVVTYFKSVSAPAATVKEGDTLTYTLTATVANSATTGVFTLTDTAGAGLDFGAVTSAGAFTCNAADPLICTLPAGTAVGTYGVTYTAIVNAQATGSVSNAVVGSGSGNPTCAGSCTTDTPVEDSAVTYAKSVAAPAAAVSVGDVLTYRLTATVANSPTTGLLTLTDTLGAGLDFTAVADAGAFTCNAANPLVCTLPTGTAVGSYSVTYTATVNADAAGSVTNAVLGSGPDDPVCAESCGTDTPLAAPVVTYGKTVAGPAEVRVGDILTYTLTATVANSATTDVLTLTDTLGSGLDLTAVTDSGIFTCNAENPLVCTLPAGTAPGTYSLSYTATVNAQASGSVRNSVVGSGGDTPSCAGSCDTDTPVAAPVISVIKSADPGAGDAIQVGQTINYSLVATVANGATTEPLILVDTPDAGLTITSLPAGCEATGATITCTLPAGTPVGTHSLTYSAVVNERAGETVRNLVTPSGGGGTAVPSCDACATEHRIELPLIRLVKTASVREVKIGDLVRYTLSVENVGERDLLGGNIVDIPPAGFTFVEGSLQVVDGDNAASVSGQSPLRFGGIDVRAGETATLAYLMRVGAGVRRGTHVNQAQVYSDGNEPVSNPATAQVELVGDPLVDETLVFGTVFDDRDGDGWQDSAALSGLHVQGGFAPGAYLPGSTTIDRGDGVRPEPDASAPLLHGIRLGDISARQSEADPVERHRMVIRQRLSALTFTDDFVLTNTQGVTVRMNAAGETRVEKSGDAAKGLNGAEPRVERRIAQGEGGYVVDYIIDNAGIDERGIPGVRIASVEGLIMETDQFGRYHLEGVPGGVWERGRNFILKVDPSTLPDGTEFTTDNPLLRRVTPGIPVRFDWGVKLPVALIEGRTETVELELGQVIFAPGSAEVREEYLPVIERMAAKVNEYQGGEVIIDANGDTRSLAFDRAEAVKASLTPRLEPASERNLVISARSRVDDPSSMVVGVDEGGALLGTVLFDTDKSDIRPEFHPLLDRVAAWLARNGGGSVAIVGHTDVRGSFDYNAALGMRRARAVYDALAGRLPPDVRSKVRVDCNDNPAAPAARQSK